MTEPRGRHRGPPFTQPRRHPQTKARTGTRVTVRAPSGNTARNAASGGDRATRPTPGAAIHTTPTPPSDEGPYRNPRHRPWPVREHRSKAGFGAVTSHERPGTGSRQPPGGAAAASSPPREGAGRAERAANASAGIALARAASSRARMRRSFPYNRRCVMAVSSTHGTAVWPSQRRSSPPMRDGPAIAPPVGDRVIATRLEKHPGGRSSSAIARSHEESSAPVETICSTPSEPTAAGQVSTAQPVPCTPLSAPRSARPPAPAPGPPGPTGSRHGWRPAR
ncbi:hypothetical protein QFZ22_003051 [Streptomyces canus]|uniref:Uncharacterized protein n=1 Tax=Streptomyces canus TaxID=58343 RepID=A0AAW8FAA8_9ACTN|nr:hypothetical protein [Streptomyces canus]